MVFDDFFAFFLHRRQLKKKSLLNTFFKPIPLKILFIKLMNLRINTMKKDKI